MGCKSSIQIKEERILQYDERREKINDIFGKENHFKVMKVILITLQNR